jgi:hypothetical protein
MRCGAGAFVAGAQFGTHASDEARGLVTISLHHRPVYWLLAGHCHLLVLRPRMHTYLRSRRGFAERPSR